MEGHGYAVHGYGQTIQEYVQTIKDYGQPIINKVRQSRIWTQVKNIERQSKEFAFAGASGPAQREPGVQGQPEDPGLLLVTTIWYAPPPLDSGGKVPKYLHTHTHILYNHYQPVLPNNWLYSIVYNTYTKCKLT